MGDQWCLYKSVQLGALSQAQAASVMQECMESLRDTRQPAALDPGAVLATVAHALDSLHVGLDHFRRTQPHLEQHAETVFSTLCQADSGDVSGTFQALPTVLQSDILTRALDQGADRSQLGAVSKPFNAYASVLYPAQRRTHTHGRQSYPSRSIPAMPRLDTITCDPLDASFVLRLLSSPAHRMPRLTTLSLTARCRHARAACVALALNTQLTSLAVLLTPPRVSFVCPVLNPVDPPQLPHLGRLESLRLNVPVDAASGDGWMTMTATPGLPLGLTALTSLTRLTALDFATDPSTCAGAAHVAFAPLAAALAALTALRTLRLGGWPCDPAPEALACWAALTQSLPRLPRLTTLAVLDVDEYGAGSAAHVSALAAALPHLPSLRAFALAGLGEQHDAVRHQSIQEAGASRELLEGIGALSALTRLELSGLGHLVTLRHCCRELAPLSRLARLHISRLGPELDATERPSTPHGRSRAARAPIDRVPLNDAATSQALGAAGAAGASARDALGAVPDAAAAASLATMLAGMSELKDLALLDVTASARGVRDLVCSAFPALPGLRTLSLSLSEDTLGEVQGMLLAEQIRKGRLPSLHTAYWPVRSQAVARLNQRAGQPAVFREL